MHHIFYIDLIPCNDSFYYFQRFLVNFLEYSVSSTSSYSFTSCFPIQVNVVTFISFSCIISPVRTSNTMLNNSGKIGHPCLVSNLKRIA